MIDFENGITVPVKLTKSTKHYYEEIGGSIIKGEQDIYIFELKEGTARDKFISRCLEDLDYCFNPEYGMKGTEFLGFATYPIGRTIRVFFSEPSIHHKDYHFFIMTADHNDLLNSLIDRSFEFEIVPREQEELFGNI